MKTIGTVSTLGKNYTKVADEKVKEYISNSLGNLLKEKGLNYEGASSLLKTAGVTDQLKDIALAAAGISKPATEATESLAGIGKTAGILSTLKTIVVGLFSTLKAGIAAHPVLAGITLATAGITAIIVAVKKLHKSQSEYIKDGEKAQENIAETSDSFKNTQNSITKLAKSYNKSAKEIKNHNDAIDSLGESYSDLYKGVNKNTNENRLLSDEDYQSYLDISNQLAEAYPQLVSGTDAQGNAILNLGMNASEAAKSIRELYNNQQLLANVEINEQLKDVYDGVLAKIESLNKESSDLRYDITKVLDPQIKDLEDGKKDIFTYPSSKNKAGVTSYGIDMNELKLEKIGLSSEDVKDYLKRTYGIKGQFSPSGGTDGIRRYGLGEITEEEFKKIQDGLADYISANVDTALDSLNAEKNQKMKQISANDLYKKDQWNKYANSLSQSLQTSSAFTDVQDQIQNAFIANLQNLDLESLTEKYDGDPYQFLYNEFLTPIANLSEEAQDTLTKALQIDPSKLNLTTYQSQIKEALEKAFPDDKDSQDLFSEALGFDQTIKDASDTAVKLKSIATQHVTDIKQTLGKLTNMTNGDKEIAYDIIANDDFSGTFAELSALVEKAKKETSEAFDINATPYMDKVEKALESENAGQNYDKITGYIKQAVELYNSGKVGTDDFKSIAALISPTGSDDVANFEENIGKAMRYFTEDSTGAKNFLADLENLDKGYVQLNEDTNQYKISIDDLQKAASDMGMSFETFMASLKNTSDYGFTNDFFATEEEGLNHLSQLYKEKNEAQMRLNELQDQDGWMDGNQTAIDAAQKKLDEYNQRIENTKDLINTIGQKTISDYDNEISSAREVLKSNLQDWMSVDPESDNAKEIKKMLYDNMTSLADTYGIDISTWFKYDDKGNVIGLAESVRKDIQNDLDTKPIPVKATLADKDIDYSQVERRTGNDGKTTVLINPVLPNGETMDEETLQKYVNDAIEGNADTSQVLGVFNGENSRLMADNFAKAAGTIKKAADDSSSNLTEDIKTLANYTSEQLNSISFNDGKWDEEFAEAEKAIDDIASKTGLDIDSLLMAFSQLGLLHVEVETDDPEKPVDEVQKAADSKPVSVPVHYKYDEEGNEKVGGGAVSVLDGQNLEPQTVTVEQNETVKYDVEASNPEHVREQVQSDLDQNPAKVKVEAENMTEAETPEGEATINVKSDTTEAKTETASMVKDIESTSAIKPVDADTNPLKTTTDNAVSNIESTTAFKPVDAETSRLVQTLDSVLNKTYTINVQANVQGMPSSATAVPGKAVANGTSFIKSGHFNDGRLGVFGRAFAQGGTVGEPRDTVALTGEENKELIVRGNHFFTVGDSGPEFVHLKKGDIVFNAQQTKELLSKGKTHTRGRALAQGNVGEARAGRLSGFGSFSGGAAGKKIDDNGNITSNDSTSSTTANTKATNANTKATNSNTSAKEKSTQVFDWVSRRLTVLSDAVQRTADTITDYVSSAFKAKQLKKEVKQIDAQINGNKKGAAAYLAKAEEVAKAYKYTDDNGNEQTVSVSDDYKKKVRNGEWSIEDMDTSTKEGKALAEAIQKYQEYYEKFEDCNDAIQGLYNTQLDIYKDLCNIPLDDAAKKVEKFTNAITNLSAAADIAGSGTSSIAAYQRVLKQRKQAYQNEATKSLKPAQDLLKSYGKVILTGLTSKNVKIDSKTKDSIAETVQQGKSLSTSQVKALKKAGLGNAATNYTKRLNWNNKLQTTVTSGTKNSFTKAEQMVLGYDSKKTASYHLQNAMVNEEVAQKRNIMNTDYAAMKKARSTMNSDKASYNKAKSSASKKANSILGNKKFKLTASQKKALQVGEMVDTTGITDPTLLSQINAYNSNVSTRKKAYSHYKISRDAYNTAQQTSQESTTAYVQAKAEAPITKLNNTKDWYDAKVSTLETNKSKVEAENSLKQSQGYDLSNKDYLKQINSNKQIEYQKKAERDVLQKQLDSSTLDKNSEEYQKWIDQITQLDTEIMQLSETNHGLYDDMRNNGYKIFERMYDASEKLRKSYSAIKDLINDDMNFDDDGKFTNAGLVSLDQTMKTYQSNQQDLDTALKQRQSYIDRFNAINEDGTKKYPEYSQQEFDNDMQNVTTTIQESIAATNASRQEAINMIAAQAKAELDALNKVIDARKEALQKKEEYYEYDKKIKSQTNDLKSLDAQINALENVNSAEAKSQKARLEAQRKESQESLDDTVIQHQYDMQINGLSDLSNQLQENYETYVKELNRNFDTANEQLDAVNHYLDANQDILKKAANEIIKGVTGKDIDFSDLSYKSDLWYSEPSKKAKGDRRVNSDQIAITQEKGEEMIMYKGGLITPLHAGDTVFNHTLTERLYDMAQNYPNLMSVPSVTRSTDADNIAPVISCPITINGNANEQDVINAVNKMMPQINKSVTTAIRADLRKAH